MLHTGIPNLDTILGGGITERDLLLVVGPAGSGKSTLVFQLAFHVIKNGQNVIYISTLAEAPNRVMQHIRPYSFFNESMIGKQLFLLDFLPVGGQGLAKMVEALLNATKIHNAQVVIFDGLMPLRSLYPEESTLRSFINELSNALAALEVTTIITSSTSLYETNDHTFVPEYTMVDGILELGSLDIGFQTIRTVRSVKMRGLANLLGLHSMRIDRKGITVFPRIESTFKSRNVGLTKERVPFGLPELDAMLHGGLLRRRPSLIAGAAGTGKTVIALQFLLEGAQKGGKSLYIGFREQPRQLIDLAHSCGIDLAPLINKGHFKMYYHSPVEMETNAVTWDILSKIKEYAPQRIVLDSVAELQNSFIEERRIWNYMTTLTSLLSENATALIMKEVPQAVGPELDFSDTPLAPVALNMLLLRNVEFHEELSRVLSILKMSGTPYDPSIRQYTITDQGIKILSKAESSESVLAGIARLPSEMRVKRHA